MKIEIKATTTAVIKNEPKYFPMSGGRPKVFCKKDVHRKTPVPESATLLKKRLWHRCFPVNFEKFLRTPFIIEHLWWLLLVILESFW